MIGKLTIDKSSMNISYFLYTIKIIASNKGKISRKNFVKEMADFVGVPAVQNNKENRTAYNKSKLPRYFGFVDIVTDKQEINYLVLTNRGKILVEYIKDNGEGKEAAERYSIAGEHRTDFIDLIFDSVIFDSFGKNNSGAEQSNTDIEPPKVVFKTILELGKATAEEICYVMFGLNRGEFETFDDAISKVKENRSNAVYDYTNIMEEWAIINIVQDCKIINIFTDSSISLLVSERNSENGKVYYQLSHMINEVHKEQLRTISAVYQPLKLFAYTNGNEKTVENWVDSTVLGRVSDSAQIIKYKFGIDIESFCAQKDNSQFQPGVFEKAVLAAYNNEKKNIYFVVNNITEPMFFEAIKRYSSVLKRIDDVKSDWHGWSAYPLDDMLFYKWLTTESKKAKNTLTDGKVLLPSNLHIVGTIIMNEENRNAEFDYEFRRCLIDTMENNSSADLEGAVDKTNNKHCLLEEFDFSVSNINDGQNLIVYGTPGCGKSYYVEHTLLKDYPTENYVRTTFFQDYTNTDFVGQILPVVDGEKVTYKFNPGPFTLALEQAIEKPNEKVALVIEELNRGSAASIFGDIFQLLDRKNGVSEYSINNVNIINYLKEKFEDKYTFDSIKLPGNLSIYATMNTSDQNVFTLDTAFKRRWKFKKLLNKFENDHKFKDKYIPGANITWKKFVDSVNAHILNTSSGLNSEDKQLGVYFVDDKGMRNQISDVSEPQAIEDFAYKVLEYLWADVAKFGRDDWFNKEIKSLDELVEEYKKHGLEVFVDEVFSN